MKTNILHLSTVVLIVLAAFSIASAWTTPVPLSEVNTQYADAWPTISNDGLTLYFARGMSPNRMYQATRSTTSSSFSNVTQISELASSDHVSNPWISTDNKHIYYTTGSAVTESTRATTSSSWGNTTYLNELNALGLIDGPKLSGDELSIVFTLMPTSNTRAMYTASRSSIDLEFTNIRALTELNTSTPIVSCLSSDGLTLYFDRVDGGVRRTYESVRPTINGTFGTPELMSFPDNFRLGSFSADGQTAYLYNYDNVSWNIYTSQIPEPATLALLALGGLMFRRGRRKS